MKIVIDLQGAQASSAKRGIGRYSMSLVKAIIKNAKNHDILIALNSLFPETIDDIRFQLNNLLPQENIHIWQPLCPIAGMDPENDQRAAISQKLREAFLASLKPDIVHVSSLFEGFDRDVVTSIGIQEPSLITSVTLYDLIPMLYKEVYFQNSLFEHWYVQKLADFHRAQLCLAISASSRLEAINYLNMPEDKVINISAAAETHFKPITIDPETKRNIYNQYKLTKPFILYTGGIDYRKNVEGLIEAFSLLPETLKAEYQLVIACALEDARKIVFDQKLASVNLNSQNVIFTDYLPEEDLVLFYNLCHLFVFPSWHEGFGLPALEAMQCGAATIAGNSSSLPEVIGRTDALFDPHSPLSIAQKIEQVLRDSLFRQSLKEHGLQQAKKFSWDKSAKCALEAFKETYSKNHPPTFISMANVQHPKMAYVFPILYLESDIARYSKELLSMLSKYYKIDVIVEQTTRKYSLRNKNYQIRSAAWFSEHGHQYDRVLYHFGNSSICGYMVALLEKYPGTVVLHDFSLSEVIIHATNQNEWIKALYLSHGYHAVQQHFLTTNTEDIISKFPCNLSVLREAIGVIVHSEDMLILAKYWYGKNCADDWKKISFLQKNSYDAKKKKMLTNSNNIGDQYYSTIENFYKNGIYTKQKLIKSLANNKFLPGNIDDLLALSACISFNHQPKQKIKQIFVDISTLRPQDLKTGIQRVVRGILKKLMAISDNQFRVEPVYMSDTTYGYRYAKQFSLNFIDCPNDILNDSPIEPVSGDIFLGLDFNTPIIERHQTYFDELSRMGVKVFFVLYDFILLSHPHYFPSGAHPETTFTRWLNLISRTNGVICISRSSAKDLKVWVEQHRNRHNTDFQIGYFPLGADIEDTNATKGISHDLACIIDKIQHQTNILMVGTIEPRKGHKQTLDAFEQIWGNNNTINLVIIGKVGWMVEDLIERLEQHPEKNKRLFWLQGISDEALLKLYEIADGLLAASEAEGFGLPLIEAARHKCPILARDIPVFREVAGEYASYFPNEKNPDTLATSLNLWLADLANKTAPKSDDMSYFTWAESTQQLLSLILDKNSLNWLYKFSPNTSKLITESAEV